MVNRGDRFELAVLTVSGFLLGILTAAFLMIRIGGVSAPITVLVAGAVNVLLLKLASMCTDTSWQYAPLGAWTLVTVLAMLPLFGSAAFIGGWQLLLLLACGLALPGYWVSNTRMKAITANRPDRT